MHSSKTRSLKAVTRARRAALVSLGLASLGLTASAAVASPIQNLLKLPAARLNGTAGSRLVGEVAPTKALTISLVLPFSHQADLSALVQHLYTPGDPLYGQYLKPGEFAAKYGPASADLAAVKAFAASHGLVVSSVSHSGSVVHLSAPAARIASAFNVRLLSYSRPDGTQFHKPSVVPTLAPELSGHVLGVIGLDNSARPVFNLKKTPHSGLTLASAKPSAASRSILYGQNVQDPNNPLMGGYSLDPENDRAVYDLPRGRTSGKGQTIGVLELDGWFPKDIAQFESTFGLPSLQPTLRSVDGGTGLATNSGAVAEVTLDIDLELSLAPDVDNLIVYQAPPTADFFPAFEDMMDAAADDDKASVLSVSYGLSAQGAAGYYEGPGYFAGIQQALTQMAAQGQTTCVSSGDAGAYQDQTLTAPNVSTFTDQPGVLSVGGTFLYTNADETYNGESSWAAPSDKGRGQIGTGGGGGVSDLFTIPPYQIGAFDPLVNPQGSTAMRNLPDVSLFGDYDEGGYSIFLTDPTSGIGAWAGYNGTSASSPLWAAFVANVNEARAAEGHSAIGLVQNTLYPVAEDAAKYAVDFHDVNDGSNNLFYNAVSGFDDSTGWGSFVGANLLSDLALSAGAPQLASLTFNPSPTIVGGPANGTVALTAPAPAGGVTVAIKSASGSPITTAFVPAHASSAVFALPAAVTANVGSTSYKATYAGVTDTGTLTVKALPTLASFVLAPNPIGANAAIGNVQFKIALSGAAPYSSAQLNLFVGTTFLGYFTMPSGVTSSSFAVPVGFIETLPGGTAGPTSTSYPFTIQYNGTSLSSTLVVSNTEPSTVVISGTPLLSPALLPASGGTATVSAHVTDQNAKITFVEAQIIDSNNNFYGTITLAPAGGDLYTGSLALPANATGATIAYEAVVVGYDSNSEETAAVSTVTGQLTDGTLLSGVSFAFGPVIRNHATGLYSQQVTVINNSGQAIPGPIELLIPLPTTVTLVNRAGTLTVNSGISYPYVAVPNSAAGLAASGPGASALVTLQFRDPTNARINYTPLAVSGKLTP